MNQIFIFDTNVSVLQKKGRWGFSNSTINSDRKIMKILTFQDISLFHILSHGCIQQFIHISQIFLEFLVFICQLLHLKRNSVLELTPPTFSSVSRFIFSNSASNSASFTCKAEISWSFDINWVVSDFYKRIKWNQFRSPLTFSSLRSLVSLWNLSRVSRRDEFSWSFDANSLFRLSIWVDNLDWGIQRKPKIWRLTVSFLIFSKSLSNNAFPFFNSNSSTWNLSFPRFISARDSFNWSIFLCKEEVSVFFTVLKTSNAVFNRLTSLDNWLYMSGSLKIQKWGKTSVAADVFDDDFDSLVVYEEEKIRNEIRDAENQMKKREERIEVEK